MNNTFRNNTRRNYAYTVFVDAQAMRTTAGDTAFRQHCIDMIRAEFKVSVAAAAAVYNSVKKAAVAQGVCEEFGRTPTEAKHEVRLVDVVRARDKGVVATGITLVEAKAIVDKAIRQKKAKLEIA